MAQLGGALRPRPSALARVYGESGDAEGTPETSFAINSTLLDELPLMVFMLKS